MLVVALGSVRKGKNCNRGLENAARSCGLRQHFQDLGHGFFPIRTSQPANNIYIFDFSDFSG